ncbi:MAG TPA: PaaI family thioesterase [Polyangiaceae bacterium]|nr:PaaI family thioesterase [Polyangiaceae bacterium]
MSIVPPDGFAPHFRKSPVTEPWEPLYSRRIDDVVQVGLTLRPEHCNSRGLVHGGVIAVLADNAMGLSCGSALPSVEGLVTVSLSVDYVAVAKVGQWLQIEPRVLKTGKLMAFADALAKADGAIIARASATFRVLMGPSTAGPTTASTAAPPK